MNRNPEQKITSVKAFVDAITTLRKGEIAANAEQWFFRGQKNSAWDIHPNIFRGDDLASEHILIERAQRQNPVEFRDCANNFEILTKLQHYGLGTRLLDVTLNPLVALYFATEQSNEFAENKNGQYTYKEHDGIVCYSFSSGSSLKDLQIRVALAVPFEEFGKSMSLEVFCSHLQEQGIISLSEHERLVSDDYAEIIKMLQTNSFIIATNSNIRLIQQRGAFLIAPAVNIKTNSNIKTSILSKAKMNLVKEFDGCFLIPANKKEEIREELDFFNVNEATLFPELEHQMRYIQNQTQHTVGTVEEYREYRVINLSDSSVGFDKALPNVDHILSEALPTINLETMTAIKEDVNSTVGMIDWYRKESVISGLRRTLTKKLSKMLSAVEAKSKANEIVEELLK